MILILTDNEEPTSDLIIDWLLYYKKPFVRICSKNIIKIDKIYSTTEGYECVFSFMQFGKMQTIDTKDITSYWYRRSHLTVGMPNIEESEEQVKKIISEYIQSEYQEAYRILNSILDRKAKINKIADNAIIKIHVLEEAKRIGLKVPDTLICNDKKTLIPFYNKHNGEIITKPIGDPLALFLLGFRSYTTRINIDNIPNQFGLSLFQEEVKKEIELRIFYLRSKFYTSAIFSQLDRQTEVDFKNYNSEKPNRVIPFILPIEIQKLLRKLMNKLSLKSGSIDMVLSIHGEYIFLEVNVCAGS